MNINAGGYAAATASRAFEVATHPRRCLDLLRLLLAFVILFALIVVVSAGINTTFWGASIYPKIARGTEMAVMAGLIVLAVAGADEMVERGAPRALAYTVAVSAAAVAGALLGWSVRAALGIEFIPPGNPYNVHFTASQPYFHRLDTALSGVLIGGLATFVHVNRRTALAARQRQHDAERARALARRRTLESELQALQARVEPMFLFDTLSHIHRLYRLDAGAAGAMLEDLIAYLRAALPHLRESTSTVAQELTLARSWLGIVGRAHCGWQVMLEADEQAQSARVPALVLLPLVQHAAAEPGLAALQLLVQVHTHPNEPPAEDAARLVVDARTHGAAFARGGPLLEQIGQRVRTLYGADAAFDRRELPEGGSQALIDLPLQRVVPDATRATP